MLEYALLLALLAFGAILGLAGIGGGVGQTLDSGSETIQSAAPPPEAPKITALAGPAPGRYLAGQSLTFTASWSQPVKVAGAPTIGLTVGDKAVTAATGGANGVTQTTFNYVITPADFDADGLQIAESLTVPNGASIRDADGKLADPALPSIDLSGVVIGESAAWVSVGAGGRIMLSPDGKIWQNVSSGVGVPLRAVSYGQSQWVAIGDFGKILTSANGVTWVARTAPRSLGLASVLYSPSHNGWIVAGAEDTILTSPDAINWTERSGFPVPAWNRGVAANGSQLVMVGEPSRFRQSTDGLQWPLVNTGATWTANGVAYGLGKFVAVGNEGQILTSGNGSSWTTLAPVTAEGLTAVASGPGGFVSVGTQGTIITSVDGTNWLNRSSGTTSRLSGVASGSTEFVTTADDGIFRWSSDGQVWYGSGSTASGPMLGIAARP